MLQVTTEGSTPSGSKFCDLPEKIESSGKWLLDVTAEGVWINPS